MRQGENRDQLGRKTSILETAVTTEKLPNEHVRIGQEYFNLLSDLSHNSERLTLCTIGSCRIAVKNRKKTINYFSHATHEMSRLITGSKCLRRREI